MNTANHISDEDLALFGLQVLPEQEVSDALVHLEHCEACRLQIGRFQGDLAAYAMTSELHSPPAQARERLMRRVAKEKKIIPIERVTHVEPIAVVDDSEPLLAGRNSRDSRDIEIQPHEMPVRSRTPVVMAWVGWALAAGLAVAAGLQFHQYQMLHSTLDSESAQLTRANNTVTQDAPARTVLETLTDTGSMQAALHLPVPAGQKSAIEPQGHVAYVPESGSLVFVASNLQPIQPGHTYELWVLPIETGLTPVPAGTFKPNASGNASVVLPELPKGVLAKGFAVTIEPDGGSAQPTMPIVLGM